MSTQYKVADKATAVMAQNGDEFARLNADGTAIVYWTRVRAIAADVCARKALDKTATIETHEAIAALLWAVGQPDVTP